MQRVALKIQAPLPDIRPYEKADTADHDQRHDDTLHDEIRMKDGQ